MFIYRGGCDSLHVFRYCTDPFNLDHNLGGGITHRSKLGKCNMSVLSTLALVAV